MKKNIKRLVAVLVVMAMIISMCSTAFAAGHGSKKSSQGSYKSYTKEVTEDTSVTDPVVESAETTEDQAVDETAETPEETTDDTETVVEDAEEAAPAEVTYPATELEDKIDGVTVHVDAPEGALPEGTTMKLAKVSLDAVQDAVDKADDITGTVVAAVDITFFDAEGTEIEPETDITVTMTSDKIAETGDPKVVHVDVKADEIEDADVAAENVEAEAEDDAVTFDADQFSVYAVVAPGEGGDNARATINFYGKDTETPVATFYVKNADLTDEEMLSQIVYDPGVDGLASGEIFKGWSISSKGTTDGKEYTSETESKTIDDVRTFLKNLSIEEGDVYNIYAMIFQAYNIQFKDEDGASIHGETLINKAGEAVSYKINTDYTPKTEDQQFQGWYAQTTTSGGISPVQETYQIGDEVEIKGDVIFTPNAPKGNWLVFDSNLGTDTDNKASYTPPQFIKTGDPATLPTAPTRVGYTFGGWYTDANCTTAFNFNTIITARTTVYAKWTVVPTAPYTVIIWKQRVTDDKNAADADKTYDVWEVISLTGNTNSAITSVTQNGSNVNTGRTNPAQTRNIRVNGTEYAQAGFHCARYDTGKTVKANGTTVVNVYYDRNLITLNFTTGNGNYRNYYFNVGNGRVRTATMTGLYDADIDFSWPSVGYSNATTSNTTNILWSSQRYNGNLTFYGSYKLREESDVNDTYTMTGGGNGTVYFYRQNEDGSWPTSNDYSNVAYVSGNNTGFTLTNKYAGFELHKYKSGTFVDNDNQWTTAVAERTANLNNGRLNIRFTRNKYPINFLDGTYFNGDGVTLKEATGVSLKTTDEIYYQASTASYNKGGADYYEPTAPAGYVFAGWYIDSTCTVPYTFTTMPEGGITVYAKWVATQYRIFLHANVDPSDTSLDWGGQSMCFRVDEDEKLADGNKIIGTRDEYELVGWYTDEAFTNPFNFDAYTINSELSFLEDYNQTESTELDKYSRPTSNTNSDAANNRVWIQKKLNLYAKWRSTMKGSRGIQIIYDAGEGTNSANNQKEYTDPLYYLDTANAIAQPAATPTDNTLHFVDWKVQKWNGSAWVDSSVRVSPGDSFEVLKANALKENNPDWDGETENEQYLYTIKVVAEYGPKDTPTPTHITWYDNFTENPVEGTNYITDNDLQINEAVNIEPADRFKRTGYKFLGWARVDTTDAQGNPLPDYTLEPQNLTEDDLYLVYNEETGKFTQDGKEVTQVAADEKFPYHDMYAVWEYVGVFYVFHSSDATVDMVDIAAMESDTYDLTDAVKDDYLYGGYFKGYFNVTDEQAITAAKAGTPVATETYDGSALYKKVDGKTVRYWTKTGDKGAYTADGSKLAPVKDTVYYLREIPQDFLGLRAQVVYDWSNNNNIDDLYLITTVDNNIYGEVGFKVTTDNKASLYASYSIQSRGSSELTKITAADLNKIGGYVGVWDATSKLVTSAEADSEFTVLPYWITLDGIRVDDDTHGERTFSIGDKTYGNGDSSMHEVTE